jgi:hypothetical protein
VSPDEGARVGPKPSARVWDAVSGQPGHGRRDARQPDEADALAGPAARAAASLVVVLERPGSGSTARTKVKVKTLCFSWSF